MPSRPHGGKLVRRVAAPQTRERILESVSEYPRVDVPDTVALDVQNIAMGVYSPLEGFLGSAEVESVIDNMRLPDDTPWTIPILLPVESPNFSEGDAIIIYHDGTPLARMDVAEIYTLERQKLVEGVFGTKDPSHPGVREMLSWPNTFVAGEILLLNYVEKYMSPHVLWPHETRILFRELGWKTVAGFQTRNVPHLGHEYVQKSALTFVDGLLVNPVLGKKKKGDYKDEVIYKAYTALFEHYYPKNTAVLSFLPYAMRYAGPREAVHHAIMRKNLGCTHFVVGRDHAGVGNFYHPYAAHEIFSQFPDLGIIPLFVREFFYCHKCGGIANEKTCPHPEEYRERFSGTKIRDMIRRGIAPPPHFMRPEVFDVVRSFDNPFLGDTP